MEFHAKFIGIIICLVLFVYEATSSRRLRRSVPQTCTMIRHYTQTHCWWFNDYGCYCGYGQSSSKALPLDPIDDCCRLHDECYGGVNCWFTTMWPQLLMYSFDCTEDGCKCSSSWSCPRSVCECDLQFARCLGKAYKDGHYAMDKRNYDWSQCQIKL